MIIELLLRQNIFIGYIRQFKKVQIVLDIMCGHQLTVGVGEILIKNRYGLISLNVHTQVKTLKKSAYWYKNLTDSSLLQVPNSILEKYDEVLKN